MTDRERLIESLDKTFNEQFYKRRLITAELTADCILSDGWIRPPCKVGDTVYWLDDEKIKQCEVFEISIHSDGILLHTGTQFCLEIENIFLTREEAEKALAERSLNNEQNS